MDFIVGCNYWASNSGADMWRDWDEAAVREDVRVLSENGIRYMRVFPNWRDFQPVMPILTSASTLAEYRLEGDRRPTNPEYLDEVMLQRFGIFCDICEEYGVKLIVGLVTGWMSGRCFVPSALFGKDLYTDPTALLFEQRLVRGIVTRFKDRSAIYAWDLGNECNCIGTPASEAVATSWCITIANAIKAADNTRPVVSGMHNLAVGNDNGPWTISGQAEACDILTMHPYPFWMKFSDKDRIGSLRTALHATCENRLYHDISGRPTLVEEIGTMGPMICDDTRAADFMRLNLLSNYVNGSMGVMWWCANEQTNLVNDPYARQMVELELGMRRADGSPRPVLRETGRIGGIIEQFGKRLPKADVDAVCILTHSQKQWGVAYMTYCLAKQAGLSIRFAWCEDALPDAKIYLMPSITGHFVMPRERYLELCRRVEEGATLYISNDNGLLAEFEALSGMRVTDSCIVNESGEILLGDERISFFGRRRRFEMTPTTARVLACDSLGYPAVTENARGKGRVLYVNAPFESMLIEQSHAFDENYHLLYRALFADAVAAHEVVTESPSVCVTLHREACGEIVCAAINYSYAEVKPDFRLADGYAIGEVLYGATDVIPAFDAVIFKLKKS